MPVVIRDLAVHGTIKRGAIELAAKVRTDAGGNGLAGGVQRKRESVHLAQDLGVRLAQTFYPTEQLIS